MLANMGLEAIRFIQKFHPPFFEQFIKFLNYFDRQEFFFILIPIIWILYGHKNGLKLFYILTLSNVSNHFLKAFFSLPRPYQIDPKVAILKVDGFGFPSGAAQTAILIAGLLVTYWKSSWKWPIAITYVLLISFSRIYLGVHFPIDILGGWIAGFLLLVVYFYLFPKIEEMFKTQTNLKILIITIALFGLIFTCSSARSLITISSGAMGLAAGIFLQQRFQLFSRKRAKGEKLMIDIPFCLLGVFALFFVFQTFFYPTEKWEFFLQFFTLGLWLSAISLFLSRKISLWHKYFVFALGFFFLLGSCTGKNPLDQSCPFCNREILERKKFYEDELTYAIYTHKPILPSHCLIIPKRHVERFEDLSTQEITQIYKVIKKVDRAFSQSFNTSSYLLLQKNGFEAGQSVPHVHFHYISRKKGDSSALKFMIQMLFANAKKPISPSLIQERIETIQAALEIPSSENHSFAH